MNTAGKQASSPCQTKVTQLLEFAAILIILYCTRCQQNEFIMMTRWWHQFQTMINGRWLKFDCN